MNILLIFLFKQIKENNLGVVVFTKEIERVDDNSFNLNGKRQQENTTTNLTVELIYCLSDHKPSLAAGVCVCVCPLCVGQFHASANGRVIKIFAQPLRLQEALQVCVCVCQKPRGGKGGKERQESASTKQIAQFQRIGWLVFARESERERCK